MRVEPFRTDSPRFRFRRWRVGSVIALLALTAAELRAETFEFHVVGIECKLCAPPIQKTLAAIPGVQKARVDWRKETASVEILSLIHI